MPVDGPGVVKVTLGEAACPPLFVNDVATVMVWPPGRTFVWKFTVAAAASVNVAVAVSQADADGI